MHCKVANGNIENLKKSLVIWPYLSFYMINTCYMALINFAKEIGYTIYIVFVIL